MKGFLALALAGASVAAPASAELIVNKTTIGQRVVVNSTKDVIATFVESDAGFNNTLFLVGRADAIFNNKTSTVGSTVNLGSFAIGTELVFRLNVSFGPGMSYDYFSGPAERNPDNLAHAAANTASGTTFVGFEDIFEGGDQDFNDLVFSFSNTAATGAVPEPASWAMMIGGFGLVGGAMRRRGKTTVRFA